MAHSCRAEIVAARETFGAEEAARHYAGLEIPPPNNPSVQDAHRSLSGRVVDFFRGGERV
jgi:hypothetical protein